MTETRTCSKCDKTHPMDNFEKNCHDEWFKCCNKCRSDGRKYGDKSKEKIMGAFIPCNICGEKFREASLPNHQRTYLCQPKVQGKPRIDYCTWLFQNEATLLPHDLRYIENIKTGNYIVVKDKYNSNCMNHEKDETEKDKYAEGENKYYKYVTFKTK